MIVTHNGKFDENFALAGGLGQITPTDDTMVMAWLLGMGSDPTKGDRIGLKDLTKKFFGTAPVSFEEATGGTKNAAKTPMEILGPYAAADTANTLRLFYYLKEQIDRPANSMLRWQYDNIQMPMSRLLTKMERSGIGLNQKLLTQAHNEFTAKEQSLLYQLKAIAGPDYNPDSPAQVANYIYDTLHLPQNPKNPRGTGAEWLENYRQYEFIDKHLDYKEYKKYTSTYTGKLLQLLPLAYTTWRLTGTRTGRLSSAAPLNLQNIPVHNNAAKIIRDSFTSSYPGGYLLVSDYSQLELRVMAHLANDDVFIDGFNQGIDAHTINAISIFKHENVDDEERFVGKTTNFAVLYGAEANKVLETIKKRFPNLGITLSDVRSIISTFWKVHPKILEWKLGILQQARRRGYVETLYGFRCYLPNINSYNSELRLKDERLAIDATIQGTASNDIVKSAMLQIDYELPDELVMNMQVHDELGMSGPTLAMLEELKPKIQEIMEHVVSLKVPLRAVPHIGTTWADAKA